LIQWNLLFGVTVGFQGAFWLCLGTHSP
jgi:hypothetical protein